MSPDSLLKFTNELEDAGWMGLAAMAALGLFNIPGSGPGALSSTDQGFVWTKSLLGSTEDKEFNWGIGKLKIQGAALNATLGVKLKEGEGVSHIDLMISFLSDGAAPSVFLEIDPKIAKLADKIKKIENPTPAVDTIIGYSLPTVDRLLKIPIPCIAIEFNFRYTEERGIISSVQLYDVANVGNAISGIIEIDTGEDVIVFPKLNGLGLYVDKLYLDLTSAGTTRLAGLFPEVYDPAWKGIGAGDITLLYPVNYVEKEFISVSVQGFLLGFDGQFSGSFNFSYNAIDPNATLKWITAELEIRNNEFIRSEVHLGLDLHRQLQKINPNVTDTTSVDTNGTDAEKDIVAKPKAAMNDHATIMNIVGIIEARVDFVWLKIDEEEILGFDFFMTTISFAQTPVGEAPEAGIVLRGLPAKIIYWAAGAGFGTYLVASNYDSTDDADNTKTFLGTCLILLMLFDICEYVAGAPTPILPTLESVTISQLGFRYVAVSRSNAHVDHYYQVIFGGRLEFSVDSILIEVLQGIGSFLLGTVGIAGSIFGSALENLRIKGSIDIEVDNIVYSNKVLPQNIKTLFKQKDTGVRVKKFPDIIFNEHPEAASHIPKPIVAAEMVSRPDPGGRNKFGLGIKLAGLASADFSVNIPASGIVIFIWPHCSWEFLPQVTELPKYTFLIPKAVYAEGILALDEPLPSFGGVQNRISVDVGLVYSSTKNEMAEYIKISNYKYKFGGEVAWGEVTYPSPAHTYGFLFVEVHYEGSSPIFVIGSAGVNGLGLLFGRNIKPGVTSDGGAMGIANWIIGKQAAAIPEDDIFKNVRDWPPLPTAETWHPGINYDSSDHSFSDQFTIGLTAKIASVNDQGKTYTAQAIALVGIPEFWIAIGAIVTLKKINSKLTVVIVYDRDSFALKVIFELSVNGEGSLVVARVPIDLGVVRTSPKKTWLYIGHYLEAKGSPISMRFVHLLTLKAYLVFDTEGLPQFGLMPVGDFPRPDITGPVIGLGGVLEWGPKRYGPSSVNISLFGALGFNVAVATDPRFIYGEAFIGGYIKLKVLFVSTSLELLAQLLFMHSDEGYSIQGRINLKLNMPWPIPDWSYGLDFSIPDDELPDLPPPIVRSTAATLLRMSPTATEMRATEISIIPIDGIISITFDKPIYSVTSPITATDLTTLLLNDSDPLNDKISEIVINDYGEEKYEIHYTHVIDSISISHHAIGSPISILLNEIPATWEVPMLYEGGVPDPNAETHHTLFINALFPPHLQFSAEQLGAFNTWWQTTDQPGPCESIGLYCINQPPRPIPTTSSAPSISFTTPYGELVIRQDGSIQEDVEPWETDNHLGWTTASPIRLLLPFATHYDLPFPNKSLFTFALRKGKPDRISQLKNLLTELRLEFTVHLRGIIQPANFNVKLHIDEQSVCGWSVALTDLNVDSALVNVNLVNAACVGEMEIDFTIELLSSDINYPIDFVKSKGCYTVFAASLMDGTNEDFAAISAIYELLINYHLELINLCIEDSNRASQQWLHTSIGGLTLTAEDAVNSLIDSMLFLPDQEYTMNYSLRSFAAIYHIGEDGTELVATKEQASLPSSLAAVRFRTEASPSQNIRQYLGFSYPMEGAQKPYAEALTPMLTFKYQGLIKRIYYKYYGREVLIPLLVDMDGNEIPSVLKQTISISSGGADPALQDTLSTCMPNAETYVNLQISVWDRSLLPDTRYSLQLKDLHDVEVSNVPYTVSFKTSRFANLITQVQYLQGLVNNAATEPLLNSATFFNDLSTLVQHISTGEQPSHDAAVEKFYLDFLGIENGKLSPVAEQDQVSFLSGLNALGEPEVWGVAIELNEPLLGKDGVTIDMDPLFPERGVFTTAQQTILLRDQSGSRILLFKQNNSDNFIPLHGNILLKFMFRPELALRTSIEQYVRQTYLDKSEAIQDAMITDQYNELIAVPSIAQSMVYLTENLNIIIPVVL